MTLDHLREIALIQISQAQRTAIMKNDLTDREHAFAQAVAEINPHIGRWVAAQLRAGSNISEVKAHFMRLAELAGRHN